MIFEFEKNFTNLEGIRFLLKEYLYFLKFFQNIPSLSQNDLALNETCLKVLNVLFEDGMYIFKKRTKFF